MCEEHAAAGIACPSMESIGDAIINVGKAAPGIILGLTFMKWIRSSHSASGNCVEVTSWRKPARSLGNGECVEAGTAPGVVAVRDSKDPGGPVLAFSPAKWGCFIAGAQNGEFDRFGQG